jgi:hypothetical protein
MGCQRACHVLCLAGGHWASFNPMPRHHTLHSCLPMLVFNSQHSILRATYPHYRPRTDLVMAMTLLNVDEVSVVGWPANQSHHKHWIFELYLAHASSLSHSHTSDPTPRSFNHGILHLWFRSTLLVFFSILSLTFFSIQR